jgi:hypothetical protein
VLLSLAILLLLPSWQRQPQPRSSEIAFVSTDPKAGPYPGPSTVYVSDLDGQHRRVLVESDRIP